MQDMNQLSRQGVIPPEHRAVSGGESGPGARARDLHPLDRMSSTVPWIQPCVHISLTCMTLV